MASHTCHKTTAHQMNLILDETICYNHRREYPFDLCEQDSYIHHKETSNQGFMRCRRRLIWSRVYFNISTFYQPWNIKCGSRIRISSHSCSKVSLHWCSRVKMADSWYQQNTSFRVFSTCVKAPERCSRVLG